MQEDRVITAGHASVTLEIEVHRGRGGGGSRKSSKFPTNKAFPVISRAVESVLQITCIKYTEKRFVNTLPFVKDNITRFDCVAYVFSKSPADHFPDVSVWVAFDGIDDCTAAVVVGIMAESPSF